MRRGACDGCHIRQGNLELLQPKSPSDLAPGERGTSKKGGRAPAFPTLHSPQPAPALTRGIITLLAGLSSLTEAKADRKRSGASTKVSKGGKKRIRKKLERNQGGGREEPLPMAEASKPAFPQLGKNKPNKKEVALPQQHSPPIPTAI